MTITASLLTSAYNNADQTSYATASITPPAGQLILAWVYNRKAAPTAAPTLSGNGLTWVGVATETTITDNGRLTLFRAMGAAPSAGAVTIDFAGITQIGCAWAIVAYNNVDTSGTDGSGAIVQSATNLLLANGMALTVTLAAFASALNATAGAIGVNANEAISQGAGFTQTTEVGGATPNATEDVQFRSDNDTTVDWSWTTNTLAVAIAVELKERVTTARVDAGTTQIGPTRKAVSPAATRILAAPTLTGPSRKGTSLVAPMFVGTDARATARAKDARPAAHLDVGTVEHAPASTSRPVTARVDAGAMQVGPARKGTSLAAPLLVGTDARATARAKDARPAARLDVGTVEHAPARTTRPVTARVDAGVLPAAVAGKKAIVLTGASLSALARTGRTVPGWLGAGASLVALVRADRPVAGLVAAGAFLLAPDRSDRRPAAMLPTGVLPTNGTARSDRRPAALLSLGATLLADMPILNEPGCVELFVIVPAVGVSVTTGGATVGVRRCC